MKKTFLSMLFALPIMAFGQAENEGESALSLEGYGELSVVRSNDGSVYGVPHVLLSAEYALPKNWIVSGEFEMETELSVTQLWTQKTFADLLSVRIGKLAIPLGMANIYDNPADHFSVSLPEMEESVLPAESNQIGFSLLGEKQDFRYEVMCLVHEDTVSAAMRVEWDFLEDFSLGVSGHFDGSYRVGMDLCYQSESLIGRGIATYSDQNRSLHTGVELGYDVLSFCPKTDTKLFAFSRYDFLRAQDENQHRIAVGINCKPTPAIALKAEYANAISESANEFALGIGISLP